MNLVNAMMCKNTRPAAKFFWEHYWEIERKMAGPEARDNRRDAWVVVLKKGLPMRSYEHGDMKSVESRELEKYNAMVREQRRKWMNSKEGRKDLEKDHNMVDVKAANLTPEAMVAVKQAYEDRDQSDDPKQPLLMHHYIKDGNMERNKMEGWTREPLDEGRQAEKRLEQGIREENAREAKTTGGPRRSYAPEAPEL